MNCAKCPSYRQGKGSQACFKCQDQINVRADSKPGPRIINMQSEIIEDIAEMIPKKVREILITLDPMDSTMLLQVVILKMNHQEIAEFHQFKARRTVLRKIKKTVAMLRDRLI